MNEQSSLDIEDIIQLDKSYFPCPWSRDQWESFFAAGPEHFHLEIYKEDKTLGFALFQLSPLEGLAHLLKILTVPHQRKRGIALKLMNQSLESLRRLDFQKLYLEVATNNHAALSFYRKFGFEELCVKKSFYSDGTNAFAMERAL